MENTEFESILKYQHTNKASTSTLTVVHHH